MLDCVLDYEKYDIELDLENGDFLITDATLKNEILLAIQTDSVDINYKNGLKQGGFINEEIGNQIWLLTFQKAWTPQIRAAVKEEIRSSLLPYGSVEFSTINVGLSIIELKTFDNQVITEAFKI
jgi:hypothetical protein